MTSFFTRCAKAHSDKATLRFCCSEGSFSNFIFDSVRNIGVWLHQTNSYLHHRLPKYHSKSCAAALWRAEPCPSASVLAGLQVPGPQRSEDFRSCLPASWGGPALE